VTLLERIERLWSSAKAAPARTRAHLRIPSERVADAALGVPFAKGQHYFQVWVNELFLRDGRQWFVKFDPMSFVATRYVYDTAETTAAFVVGPTLLEEFKDAEMPEGMIFRNTPVSGLHPYQGGEVELTVLLSRLPRENNADRLLHVVESVSSAIDPSTVFSTYVKLGRSVLDGVEALLGIDGSQPVMGYRVGVQPSVGIAFEPGYHAMLDVDENEVDAERFFVKDSRLHQEIDGELQPYRGSDFLLFSIRQGVARDDERLLPFYPLWQTAQDLAAQPGEHFWEEAKSNFNALKRAMLKSPDLTKPDYARLREEWLGELTTRREEAVMDSELSAEGAIDEEEAELADVARRLDNLD
jgi:hypothetical protein